MVFKKIGHSQVGCFQRAVSSGGLEMWEIIQQWLDGATATTKWNGVIGPKVPLEEGLRHAGVCFVTYPVLCFYQHPHVS